MIGVCSVAGIPLVTVIRKTVMVSIVEIAKETWFLSFKRCSFEHFLWLESSIVPFLQTQQELERRTLTNIFYNLLLLSLTWIAIHCSVWLNQSRIFKWNFWSTVQECWWVRQVECSWKGRIQGVSKSADSTWFISSWSSRWSWSWSWSYVTSAKGFGQQLGIFTSCRVAQNFFSSNTPCTKDEVFPVTNTTLFLFEIQLVFCSCKSKPVGE